MDVNWSTAHLAKQKGPSVLDMSDVSTTSVPWRGVSEFEITRNQKVGKRRYSDLSG